MDDCTVLHSAIAAALVGTAAPSVWAQPCQPYWGVGTPPPALGAYRMIEFDDGSGPALFTTYNDRPYRWHDGDTSWTRIDAGLPASLTGLDNPPLVLDDGSGPHLCVVAADPTSSWVARWTGQSWERPWPGMLSHSPPSGPYVSGDVGDGPSIYGFVFLANHYTPARWVADHWETFGTPINGDVTGEYIFDDGGGPGLFVYGGFSTIGGISVPANLVRWRNHQWTAIGVAGSEAAPEAVYDDGTGLTLYSAGGHVIGGTVARGLVKLTSQGWVTVGQHDPPGAIYGLGDPFVFDDGSGPAIYVYGGFTNMGGVPATGIAKYNGHWSTVGDGVHMGSVYSLATMQTSRGRSLFVSGDFQRAGGGVVQGSARIVACPNCYANCDQSSTPPVLNVNDFVCFLGKFAAGDPYANCDGSTTPPVLNVNDFVCFLTRFAAGCP